MHKVTEINKMLKVDPKGRISLGKLLPKGVSSFKAYLDHETNNIILEPYTDIPLREVWLFKDPELLNKLKAGIKQSAEGKTRYIGSFATHAKESSDAL